MKYVNLLLPAAAILITAATFTGPEEEALPHNYMPVNTGYVMVLHTGDDVLKSIEEFAERERIPSASFSGIGFVHATFGYFNRQTKQYEPKEFTGMELGSLNGSIAWQNDTVSVHAHAIATNKKFEAVGGHLLKAIVGNGSVEIYINVYEQRLERKKEEAIGANILQLK